MIKQHGQTLVEMIVIVGVIVLLATGIVAGTTASLGRSETLQIRSEALSEAQAGIELTRALRDAGWDDLVNKGTPETAYCVGSGGWAEYTDPPCVVNINNMFTRTITLKYVAATLTVQVISEVAWGDTSNPLNKVYLTTYLTNWKLQ